jgi:ankyrin repeat protein
MEERNNGIIHFEMPNYRLSDEAEPSGLPMSREAQTFTSVTNLQISMKHCMAACLVAGLVVPAAVKEAYGASEGEMLGMNATTKFSGHIDSGTIKEHTILSPLATAAYRGKTEMVKQLLTSGAFINEVDKEGYTALGYAAESGNVAMVKYLMESGADAHLAGDAEHVPLLLAIKSGDAPTAEQLLQMASSYSMPVMQRAYAIAIEKEKRGMIAQLLLSGVTPEKSSSEATYLVLYAAKHGDNALLGWMKENGYELNKQDEKGKSALMYAANFGKIETVQWLAASGAKLEQTDHTGYTALTHAAAKNHVDIAKLLVSLGANISHQTEAGNTPLHIAVSRGQTDMVAYLASLKPDFKVRNDEEQTPMMMAIANNNTLMVELLLKSGDTPYQPVTIVKNATGEVVAILESYKKKHSILNEIL